MSKNIFWISSYPKSGNTLIRAILSSLFFTKDGLFSLEKLKYISQFETTSHIYKNKNIIGKDLSNIGDTSILFKYLLKLQTKESLRLSEDFMFLKTHSGLFEIGGNPFTTKENTRGIIYIVRDPRDICISWGKHLGISLDKSLNNITNNLLSSPWVEPNQKTLFEKENRPKSFVSSWDKHVLSWTSVNWDTPIKIIRYEDLVYNKKDTINDLVSFFVNNYKFKFENIDKKIENIITSTNFNKLKKEELNNGFIESSEHNNFFSVGKKDQWKEMLNKDQIKKIEQKLGKLMKKYNYKLSVEF